MSADALKAIRTQVMWNRLIAVVEEQAQSLLRTAFGAITREAGDLSAGVYDTSGRMLAQAMTGTPGHINTMATAVAAFLHLVSGSHHAAGRRLHHQRPLARHRPSLRLCGDDAGVPGHEARSRFFASTCHVIDVGGVGLSAKGNSSFEEGTLIPHLKLRKAGVLNEELLSVILANSRNPVEVRGDLLSLVSANDTGARRLIAMMEEFGLRSIDALADHITRRIGEAVRARQYAGSPDGEWSYEMPLDGYERPILLKARLTIDQGRQITSTSRARRRPRSTASTARAPIRTPIRCSA